ncbi:glycosyltransferase family 2 protein [Polynucleobacter sp. MWH-UH24A]|uniref:glycosyltransferase family 2 protein n=1 Tax=Polynucleobacter sp. MWH-UH24A TaxID=2689110 RepID=UPI001BFD346B|nr:glycosyltransferase [Polynucleobacter sp. MWH-UH24A]QWD76225.1 glycosyltransferase family 2 protein [Polynucleobacter sp. MWH-UH24A]
MGSIGVVIPFYKQRKQLEKCLELIRQQTINNIKIYVKDNSEINTYFTSAVNEGIQTFVEDREIEYILVLNQDAYLEQNTVEELVNSMIRNQECGISAPIQISENGNIVWSGGLEAFPLGNHQIFTDNSATNELETFWVNGAAMLLRKQMVREIGLLDKNMQFICSDADYSFTARSRGWKLLVSKKAFVQHDLSGSKDAENNELTMIKINDAIYFTKKWINGDLYRSLAIEGRHLTNQYVDECLKIYLNELSTIKKSTKMKR